MVHHHLLQVATHCATAVTAQPERTAKLAQKFVRAGALRAICALLALSIPRACTAGSSAATADAVKQARVKVREPAHVPCICRT